MSSGFDPSGGSFGAVRRACALPRGGRLVVFGDCHLTPSDPARVAVVARFLRDVAATHLVCLGDLFDAWVGDEALYEPAFRPVLGALRAASDRGVAAWLVHGNRDFLLGRAFTRATGVAVCPRALGLRLADGARVLIQHGDLLASADRRYQRMRRVLRGPPFRGLFGQLPARLRAQLGAGLRRTSRREIAIKPTRMMDLDPLRLTALVDRGARWVVCGHVHRPERRAVVGRDAEGTLLVVGDWTERGGHYVESCGSSLQLARFGAPRA